MALAALMLSACAGLGHDAASNSSSANAVQWKEVTRLEGGNFVTYRVPVTQNVPDNVNMRNFNAAPAPPQQAAATGPADAASFPKSAASEPPARAPAPPAEDLPWAKVPIGAPVMPPLAQAAGAGHPVDIPGAGTGSNVNQEAETELGRAEIAVRDAQSRFETAQAALKRAQEAARAGDNASAIKYARTAVSLSQPGR